MVPPQNIIRRHSPLRPPLTGACDAVATKSQRFDYSVSALAARITAAAWMYIMDLPHYEWACSMTTPAMAAAVAAVAAAAVFLGNPRR